MFWTLAALLVTGCSVEGSDTGEVGWPAEIKGCRVGLRGPNSGGDRSPTIDYGWPSSRAAKTKARGEVVAIDPDSEDAEAEVILTGLDKPTGLAFFGGDLWVMERDRLTRGPIDGSQREVVVDSLPNNGRSEGTLTVDGSRLLYNTSGALGDDRVPVDDSASLWAVDEDGAISVVAKGFKNAYAHVRTASDRLFVTEIADGRFDGEPAADEVIEVVEGRRSWVAQMCRRQPRRDRPRWDRV